MIRCLFLKIMTDALRNGQSFMGERKNDFLMKENMFQRKNVKYCNGVALLNRGCIFRVTQKNSFL